MTQQPADSERFVLTFDRDGLSCTLAILPGDADSVPTEISILAALEEQRVDPNRLVEGAIEGLLAEAEADPASEHAAVIARGIAPVHGGDGGFELCDELAGKLDEIKRRNDLVRDMSNQGRAAEMPDGTDGAIDFREMSAFVIVKQGDVVGTVHEKDDGTDGIDVRGQTIPAKKGKSCPIKIGNTIEVTSGEAVAKNDGVLKYRIDSVEVSPTLDIAGDVDYETGNVDFPGDVDVLGGVKDHFVVKAGGAITIHKLVEAAEIIGGAGGVSFKQGMAGRELGLLDLEGDLHAGYLDGVKGEIHGDLRVDREIKECTLRVEGGVISPECAVYGGSLEAVREIEIGVAGGPGGVPTEICVGRLPELESMAERVEHLKHDVDLERDQTKAEYEALNQSKNLTATQAERLTELQFLQITREELAGKIVQSCEHLLEAAAKSSRTSLMIHRAAYKGVRIRLRNAELRIREMVQGPIVLDLDPGGLPRCTRQGQPVPIGEVAMIEDTGEKTDPIRRLSAIAAQAA